MKDTIASSFYRDLFFQNVRLKEGTSDSKMKDVLFLCQFFYPEYVSSATLPYDTAVALAEAGLSVDVLCGCPKEYCNKRVAIEETHRKIGIRRLRYIQTKRSSRMGRLINFFSFTLEVLLRIRRFKKYRTLVVYSNPPILPMVASLAYKLYGIKVIFVCFDAYPEIAIATNKIKNNGILSSLMIRINKSLFRIVHHVVVISEDMKRFLLANRKGLKEEQVSVIYNWYQNVTMDRMQKTSVTRIIEHQELKNRFIVSYFGNIGTAQDVDTLICAIKRMNSDSVGFMFAGHGNKFTHLRNQVEQNALQNVYISEYLHGDDYLRALNDSDVFVVTLNSGLSDLAMPSKTYSYLMAGKPVISIMNRDAELSRELVEHDAGFSVEIGDVEALIRSIDELRSDEEKRQNMGENARQLFERKYTTEICTEKYISLLRKTLDEI